MPKYSATRMSVALTTLLAAAPLSAIAATWSDTYIGDRYGTSFREPYNSQDIGKNIIQLTHASGYDYGSNFFNVDMLRSDTADAANGGGGGAQEVYVVYRTTLSLSAVTGHSFKTGWLRDLGITAGFDYNAKDDQFSARVWKTALGPKVSFDVPGWLEFAWVWRTEHNHNWFATGPAFGGAGCMPTATSVCHPDVHFKDTSALESDWGINFNLGLPAQFWGYLDYIGAKGRDGVGAQTKPETLLETALLFDVGSLCGRKGAIFVGPGYQYWNNKFGNDASRDPTGGSKASVPELDVNIHF